MGFKSIVEKVKLEKQHLHYKLKSLAEEQHYLQHKLKACDEFLKEIAE